ncbi:intron-binding protein aquarius, partial [Tanacetum coccineum]
MRSKSRYFKPLVADVAVYYEGFEIDDNLGRQMTDDEVLQAHYERFQAFQLLSLKKIPKLKELALANIGAIHKRADLSKNLYFLLMSWGTWSEISSMLGVKEPDKVTINNPGQSTTKGYGGVSRFKFRAETIKERACS